MDRGIRRDKGTCLIADKKWPFNWFAFAAIPPYLLNSLWFIPFFLEAYGWCEVLNFAALKYSSVLPNLISTDSLMNLVPLRRPYT